MAYNDGFAKAWYPKREEAPIFTAADDGDDDSGKNRKRVLIVVILLVLAAIIAAIVVAVMLLTNKPAPPGPTPLPNQPPLSSMEIDGDLALLGPNFSNPMNLSGTPEYDQLNKDVCDMLKNSTDGNGLVSADDCKVTAVSPGCVRIKYRMKFRKFKGITTSDSDCMKFAGRHIVNKVKRRRRFGRWGYINKRSCRFQSLGACEPNPCQNGGKCVNNGDSYECRCVKGHGGKKCKTKPTWCYCSGDPHCHTFDNAKMDFQSTCRFTLAESLDGSFKISGRNMRLNGNAKVAFARWIEIKSKDKVRLGKLFKRKLKKGPQAMVNFKVVSLPYEGADYKIYRRGKFIEYQTNNGLIISYKNYYYRIGLPANLKEQVKGFCGNFDGLRNNDFITKDGEPLPKKIKSGYKIGNSWLEEEDPDDTTDKCSQSPDEVKGIEGTESSTLIEMCPKRNLKQGKILCKLLTDVAGVFGPCLQILDPILLQTLMDNCVLDVEQTCSQKSTFDAFNELIMFCEQVDETTAMLVDGWQIKINATTEDLEAEQCINGMVQLTNTVSCVNTCEQPDTADHCPLPITPATCGCPQGTYLFNDQCVKMEQCGCTDADGNERNIDETWLDATCGTIYTCEYGGLISQTSFNCSKNCHNSKCTVCAPNNPCSQGVCSDSNNSTTFSCACKPGFVGDTCDKAMAGCVIFGIGNCKSFDGKPIKYRGSRQIILVQGNGFKIYGRNRGKAGKKNAPVLQSLIYEKNGNKIVIQKKSQTQSSPFVLKNAGAVVDFPFAQGGVNINLFSGKVRMIVSADANSGNGTEPVLVITFSSKFRASIQLSPSMKNTGLSGFCGNYNGVESDDNKSANGTVLTDELLELSFLDMNDTEDMTDLIDVNASMPVCMPYDNLDKYLNLCQLFMDAISPFSICASSMANGTITAMEYSVLCKWDVNMTCDGSLAITNAFSFSEECQEMGININITEIISALNITQKCSVDQTLADLVVPCIATCSDPTAPDTCNEAPVADVCVCPPGQVLFLGSCISQFECGCSDENGQLHMLGDSWYGENCAIKYTCEPNNMISNTSFECVSPKSCVDNKCTACTNNSCTNGNCIDSNTEPFFSCQCYPKFTGENCSIEMLTGVFFGNGYCFSYDGQLMNYHGTARFLLTGSHIFKIFLRMTKNEDGILVLRYIEVIMNGNSVIITIINGKLMIKYNGVENINIPSDFGDFQLIINGDDYQVLFMGCSLKVSITGTIIIQITSEIAGNLTGVLGNADGNSTDDLRTANGTKTNSTDAIGDSYAVPDIGAGENQTIGLVGNDTSPPPPATNPYPISPFCNGNNLEVMLKLCGALVDVDGIFAPCLTAMPQDIIDFYHNQCLRSISETCMLEMVTGTVNVYILFCSKYINGSIDYHSLLEIGGSCADPIQVFMETARACPATCDDPDMSQPCLLPDALNVCMCPAGTVLYMSECIAPDQCGCVDNSTVAHKINDVWLDSKCTVNNTCTAGGIITSEFFKCPNNQSCDGNGGCVAQMACKNGTCSAKSVCKETPGVGKGYVCECPITEAGENCQEQVGSCGVFGNYHFDTFDGAFLDFSSECEVSLVNNSKGNESFSVGIFGEKRNQSNFIMIRQMIVNVYSKVVMIGAEENQASANNFKILINDVEITEFPYEKDELTILKSGPSTATVKTGFNMKIIFEMLKDIQIFLPASFGGNLKGMCGNFNGKESDDIILNEPNGNCSNNSTTNSTLVCDQPVPAACSLIANVTGVFGACLNTTFLASDMAAFAEMCAEDYNVTCDEESVLEIVLYMAVKCQGMLNETIDFCEELNLNCSEICVGDHVSFVSSTSSCPATCKVQDASVSQQICLTLPDFSTCACQEGFVNHNGLCINPADCGCYTDDGQYKPILDKWIDNTCSTMFMCNQDAQIIASNFSCSNNKTCLNGTCTSCFDDPCNGGECSDIPDGTLVCRCKLAGPQGPFCNETTNSTMAMILNGGLISTFDGAIFSFQTASKFIFVQSGVGSPDNFTIFVKFARRKNKSKMVVLNYVSVESNGYCAKIKVNGHGLRGKLKYSLTKIDGGLIEAEASNYFSSIIKSSAITLKTKFNFTITVTQSGTIVVDASHDFFDTLTGLAGNNNGNSIDDLILQNGLDLFNLSIAGELLGLQFEVAENDPAEIFLDILDTSQQNEESEEDQEENLTTILGEEPPLPEGCDALNMNNSLAMCDIQTFLSVSLIADCFKALNEKLKKLILITCTTAVLEDCDSSNFLNIILSMNEASLFTNPNASELPLSLMLTFSGQNSSGDYQCPDPSMQFLENVISCMPTCGEPNAMQTCTLPNSTFGCVCPPDMVLFAGQCISPENCGCIDDTGVERMLQEKWLTTDCMLQKTCNAEGETSLVTYACPNGTSCNNGICSVCFDNPCRNGGTCKDIIPSNSTLNATENVNETNPKNFQCFCTDQFKGETCEEEVVFAKCQVIGSSNIITFDGLAYHYEGPQLTYLIAASADYSLPNNTLDSNSTAIPTNTTTNSSLNETAIAGSNTTAIPANATNASPNGTTIAGSNTTAIPSNVTNASLNGSTIAGSNTTEIPTNATNASLNVTTIAGSNTTAIPSNVTNVSLNETTIAGSNTTAIPTNATNASLNVTTIAGSNTTAIPANVTNDSLNGTTIAGSNTTAIPTNSTTNASLNETTIADSNSTLFAIFAVNQVNNESCGDSSIVNSVKILYANDVVWLRSADENTVQIEVNGLVIQPPYFSDIFQIKVLAEVTIFTGANNLVVSFDANFGSLTVILPGDSNEATKGICGNHDNVTENDAPFSNITEVDQIGAFISSFTFPKEIETQNSTSNADNSNENAGNLTNQEVPNCANVTEIQTICEFLLLNNSFSQCLNEQDKEFTKNIVDACKIDAKIFGVKSAACNYLEILSKQTCINFDLGDWRSASGCEIQLGLVNEYGLIWQSEVSACRSTCTNPHARNKCRIKRKLNGGWGCANGKVIFKDHCVDLMQCGCKSNLGVAHKKEKSTDCDSALIPLLCVHG